MRWKEQNQFTTIRISSLVADKLFRYKKMKHFKNYDALIRDIVGLPPMSDEELTAFDKDLKEIKTKENPDEIAI